MAGVPRGVPLPGGVCRFPRAHPPPNSRQPPSQDLAFKFLAKAISNHSQLKALPLNPWGSHWLSLWGQGFSHLDHFTVSKDICGTNL